MNRETLELFNDLKLSSADFVTKNKEEPQIKLCLKEFFMKVMWRLGKKHKTEWVLTIGPNAKRVQQDK